MLAVQCVIFVALLLQLWCRPYAHAPLNRLQVASLVVLVATTFALMAPALNEALAPWLGADSPQSVGVTAAALAFAGVLNLGVLAAFVRALVIEGRHLVVSALDKDGKGHVTLSDVRAYAAGLLRSVVAEVRGSVSWLGSEKRAATAARARVAST